MQSLKKQFVVDVSLKVPFACCLRKKDCRLHILHYPGKLWLQILLYIVQDNTYYSHSIYPNLSFAYHHHHHHHSPIHHYPYKTLTYYQLLPKAHPVKQHRKGKKNLFPFLLSFPLFLCNLIQKYENFKDCAKSKLFSRKQKKQKASSSLGLKNGETDFFMCLQKRIK